MVCVHTPLHPSSNEDWPVKLGRFFQRRLMVSKLYQYTLSSCIYHDWSVIPTAKTQQFQHPKVYTTIKMQTLIHNAAVKVIVMMTQATFLLHNRLIDWKGIYFTVINFLPEIIKQTMWILVCNVTDESSSICVTHNTEPSDCQVHIHVAKILILCPLYTQLISFTWALKSWIVSN